MKKKFLIPLLSILTLTSCGFSFGFESSSSSNLASSSTSVESNGASSNQTTTSNENSTSKVESSSNTVSSASVGGNNYYVKNASEFEYSLQDVNSQLNWVTSRTTGDVKFLVVPVQLSGATTWTSSMLTNLNNAFFGESNDTNFESVSSFYKKSSYGRLNITGTVDSVLKSTYTKSYLSGKGESAPDYIIQEFYNSASASLLKEYDGDGDGYIDNAIFIYSNAYETSGTGAYWAWCYNAIDISKGTDYLYSPNTAKPTVNSYMWASYTFMDAKYNDSYNSSKIDAHTYIHETGHMLGLDDYYNADDSDGWDCAGTLEMQSYNVGDQNIYSKMAMGWVDPYVVTGSTTINLKTSAKYGEAILINDQWNGSQFDEYILIEYYTPTGLNEADSKHRFDSRDKMYDYNGLRIYHIDARLIKMSSSGKFVSYSDKINDDNYYYYVGASNTSTYSYLNSPNNSKYRYVHLLDQGGNNRLNNGRGGTVNASSALWTGSKSFSASSTFFANGTKFNDGTSVGYTVSVSNLGDEECTVTISKI